VSSRTLRRLKDSQLGAGSWNLKIFTRLGNSAAFPAKIVNSKNGKYGHMEAFWVSCSDHLAVEELLELRVAPSPHGR